jgi:poly(3-hydroxybutyrate) depolymerase
MIPLLLSLALGCSSSGPTGVTDSAGETGSAEQDPEDGFQGEFTTENSAGRRGRYLVPDGWNLGPLAVLVAYHGTGGEGLQMLDIFADQATLHGFAIVAPDSRVSPGGAYTWEVGTEPGEITEDVLHTQALLQELTDFGVTLDEGRFLATGFSGGGSSGPYMATNDPRFNAYGSQHGGAFPGGMGDNRTAGWFSTGQDDDVRDPDHVQGQADDVAAAGYPEPEVRIYPGGHAIGDQELEELVAWWLTQDSP